VSSFFTFEGVLTHFTLDFFVLVGCGFGFELVKCLPLSQRIILWECFVVLCFCSGLTWADIDSFSNVAESFKQDAEEVWALLCVSPHCCIMGLADAYTLCCHL
jgi:hypothetical protein